MVLTAGPLSTHTHGRFGTSPQLGPARAARHGGGHLLLARPHELCQLRRHLEQGAAAALRGPQGVSADDAVVRVPRAHRHRALPL